MYAIVGSCPRCGGTDLCSLLLVRNYAAAFVSFMWMLFDETNKFREAICRFHESVPIVRTVLLQELLRKTWPGGVECRNLNAI